MNKPPLTIAICGLGTVAQGVLALLKRNESLITQRAGRPIRVRSVASRTERPEVDLLGGQFSTDVLGVTQDPEVDLVLELIGGETLADELVRSALRNGKHVVTANKAIIAHHGDDYLELAAARDLAFAFESAVAGGIPVIGALTRGLAANEVNWIAGIINGTSNYILSEMAQTGQSFAAALAQAQELGYAEADPTFDVGGIDAAHKLTILAALAFGMNMRFDSVYTEGIEALGLDDIEYAQQLGYRIRHLGIARRSAQGVELRVHPTLIPQQQLLASVDGVMNAVMFNSDAAGDTLYYGAGAGAGPTASAVVADLIEVAAGSAHRGAIVAASEPSPAVEVIPVEQTQSGFYLNIPSLDQPGVFARAATILSDHNISIDAVIQKEHASQTDTDQSWVPIVILTHAVSEGVMNEAIAELQAMPEVVDSIKRIRVEHFV